MRKRTGQGLAEYSLIAGMIVLLAIPALFLLGGNISDMAQSMIAPMPKNAKPSLNVASAASVAKGNSRHQPTNTLADALGFDAFSSKALAKEIQTAGANGATEVLANRIEQIAQQKLAAGEMTQDQFNRMMALANQGHRLAAMESLVEDAAAKASNPQAFMDQTIVFEGKKYTVADFGYLFGFSQSGGLLSNPLDSARLAYPEMKTFISMYDQVVASGALTDAATQAEVKKLASDIANINDSVLFAMQDLGWDESIQPSDFTGSAAARVANLDASGKTNQKSGKLCTYGHGKDNGSQCDS